ncbi:Uncharacterised protein [Escherichia coli]|uniref:Uncharacterized protein n=1 Tax=Escherichia coli TaxID=562 RepID=A0A377D5J5_ECOLX|nr:Uncharacterised protein [Escherichia coli]
MVCIVGNKFKKTKAAMPFVVMYWLKMLQIVIFIRSIDLLVPWA